jgi:hypothetical protein
MRNFERSIFALLRSAFVATAFLSLPAGYAFAQNALPSGMDVGRKAAEQTAEWVEEKINERFPEDSLVRQATEKVKKHPDLAKKLGQAALNPDRGDWWATSREVLREYAQRELKEQQEKGIDIWKEMARDILNPSGSLSNVGLDPVDLYAQGVSNWTDFVQKSGTRYHGAVLDCFYDKYREAIPDGQEAADLQVLTAGTAGNRCGGEKPRDTFASQISSFIQRMTGGLSTSAGFKLSHEELMELLKEFHTNNGRKPGASFSDWMQERFDNNLTDRKNRLRAAMDREQAQATGQPADTSQSSPPAPGNDQALLARLDSAFAALDAFTSALELKTGEDRAQCARASDALKPDKPDSVPNRVKAIQELIDQAVFDRKQIGADKDLYDDFRRALDTMGRTAGLADDSARAACTASQSGAPDFAVIRTEVEKVANLGVLASQIGDTARTAANKLSPRLASTDILPTVKQSLDRIRSRVGDTKRFCDGLRAPIAKANDLVTQMQGPGTEISRALNEAVGGKLSPATAAAYRSRLDNHVARVAAVTERIESCSRDIESVADMCGRFQQDVTNQLAAIELARTELTADREAMARQVRFDTQKLQDHINHAAAAKARADKCLADAEKKKPAINPKLLGEANDLADPSKVACKSVDLRSRAARLRDPKYSGIPGIRDKADEFERLAGIYDTAKRHFDNAKATYERADIAMLDAKAGFGRVHAELDNAQRQINSIADKLDCSSSRQTIAQARDRADRLAEAIQRAKETLYQCESDTLRAHIQAIDEKSKHPAFSAFKQRMQRQLAALNRFNAANDVYRAGNLAGARDQLDAIKTSIASAPPDDCPVLRKKVDNGLERIATLTRVASQVDEAIRTCNVEGIKRFNYELQDSDQATLKQMRGRLITALESCTRTTTAPATTNVARAHDECKASLGSFGIAVQSPDSLKGYRCDCESPYRLDGGACVRRKTENELAAERDATCEAGYRAGPVDAAGKYSCLPTEETADAWCKANNNSGYFADRQNDGTYSCIPTRETANAWCREKNGAGVVAGRINADGSHGCVLTKAAADARCRQANPGLQGVYAGTFKADGTFDCFGSQPTAQRAPAPQPQHDAASTAAAAAVAGAMIQGVMGAVGNRSGGGNTSTYVDRRPDCVPGRDIIGCKMPGLSGRQPAGGSGLRHDQRTSISGY